MASDRKAALVLLTFSAGFAYMTARISAATLPGAPGPRTFPWVMVTLMAFLSILLFLRSSPNQKEKEPFSKAMLVYATICFYVILIPVVGFLAGTAIGIFIFFYWTLSSRKKAAIAAILIALALYIIFEFVFRIKLPSSILFQKGGLKLL
ncbi:tripartite tricarboxylate transporter TctB family protein [Lachnospiraceae bacterium 62-35]